MNDDLGIKTKDALGIKQEKRQLRNQGEKGDIGIKGTSLGIRSRRQFMNQAKKKD